MLQDILLNVKENLTNKQMLNKYQIDRLIENMEFWEKNDRVYPSNIKAKLNLDYKRTYEVLNLIKDMGILNFAYEMYCHECEEFIDNGYLKNIRDFPEEKYCDNDHKLNPIDDTILIYRVIKDGQNE